jgi:hypothetical protein
MLWMRLAQVGLWIDSFQSHQPHKPLNPSAAYLVPYLTQDKCHSSRAKVGSLGILLINEPHQLQLIIIHPTLIVDAGSSNPQKLCLSANR